jgi:hypothetical protein
MEFPEHILRKPMTCPWCKNTHDAAMGLTNAEKPAAGDVVLCLNCGHINLVFGASELRRPTEAELVQAINETPELLAAMAAWNLAFGAKRDDSRG